MKPHLPRFRRLRKVREQLQALETVIDRQWVLNWILASRYLEARCVHTVWEQGLGRDPEMNPWCEAKESIWRDSTRARLIVLQSGLSVVEGLESDRRSLSAEEQRLSA